MRLPKLSAVVERRLLVNYRVDPEIAARLLPAPLRPQLVDGAAVGGICLIRLGAVRPRLAPAVLGVRSENAAHRIAVTWDTPLGPRNGVYIPRRHSDSVVNVWGGGRLFPGEHAAARFTVAETADDLSVAFSSRDQDTHVRVASTLPASTLPASTLFDGIDAASAFFRDGNTGYSATRAGHCLDGIEMVTNGWDIEPVTPLEVESSYYDDRTRFPAGTAVLDSVLVMRNMPVTWVALPPLPIAAGAAPLPAAAPAA